MPSKWKIARLIPIHKSGSRKLPENFRPISVLPVLSKLLEKNIHRQYMNFLEEEKLYQIVNLATGQGGQQI